MKKLLTLLLAVILVLSFASCVKDGGICSLLFENTLNESDIALSFDIDGDGADDEINVVVTEDCYIEVISDGADIKLGHGEAYYIYRVYGIDIDTGDKKKELVIITDEVSNDVMLRVLRLEDNEFKLLNFENTDGYTGESYIHDTLSVGYDAEILIDGNTLKTSKRGNYGMWTVEAEYSFDGEKFTEKEMDDRKVVLSSYAGSVEMAGEHGTDLIVKGYLKSEEELLNLKEGYVTARADFVNYGEVPTFDGLIAIKTGDAFKILKENSEGFVFIEKKTGESGWIYMGDFRDNRHEVSEIAFYMAD